MHKIKLQYWEMTRNNMININFDLIEQIIFVSFEIIKILFVTIHIKFWYA